VTERDLLLSQLAKKYPEDEKLWQETYDKYGKVGTLALFRQKNADRNRGELNCQFIKWILSREDEFCQEIKKYMTDENGKVMISDQKVKFTLYGMLYVILKWEGCYVRGKGKRNAPNEISYNKFCSKELFDLQGRLKSKNVRKTLANLLYSHNYLLNENNNRLHGPTKELESVFKFIHAEITKYIDKER
jgi:hypothetical protein